MCSSQGEGPFVAVNRTTQEKRSQTEEISSANCPRPSPSKTAAQRRAPVQTRPQTSPERSVIPVYVQLLVHVNMTYMYVDMYINMIVHTPELSV